MTTVSINQYSMFRCRLHQRDLSRRGTSTDLTPEEKSLIEKIPQQWRGLLTLLLSSKSVNRDRLMTIMAMRYRRRVTHTIESWDALLSAMSRRIPVVDDDGALCFQSLLWRFPESFVQDFLQFLLRFHDTVSPDSLDRFRNIPVPESCVPFAVPLFHELSAVLAKRGGTSLGEETVGEKYEKMCVETLTVNSDRGIDGKRDITMVHSGIIIEDAFIVGEPQGKSGSTEQACSVSSESDANRLSSETVRNRKSDAQGKEIQGSDPLTTLPALSEQFIPHPNTAINLDNEITEEELFASAKTNPPTKTDSIKKSDSFILILDSSDEDEDVLVKETMEVDFRKDQGKVSEGNQDGQSVMNKESGKEGRGDGVKYDRHQGMKEEEDEKEGQFVRQGLKDVELQSHEGRKKEESEEEGKLVREGLREDERQLERRQGDRDETRMSEDARLGESFVAAGQVIGGKNGNVGAEILTQAEKLKEALSSRHGDASSSDFDFLLTIPASQVDQSFAAVEWGDLEEEAVCGLIQSIVGLSEKLSQAVGAALVESIVRPIYEGIREIPSRQLMSSLSDLATTYSQQLASVLCDCLQRSPCSGVQSEMVTSLCKNWTASTLLCFLRRLCRPGTQLDVNLLSVVQCVLGQQPDLSSNLLESVLQLLETGSAPLARNAKYGRLVLNFVKNYKTQMNASHGPSLQSIANTHASVIRKSLQTAVNALPS